MKDEQGEFSGWDVAVRRRHDRYGHHVSFNRGMRQQQGAASSPSVPQMVRLDVFAEGQSFKVVWPSIEDRHLLGIAREAYERRAIGAVRTMIAAGA